MYFNWLFLTGKDAGAVDEDLFIKSFEDVPTLQIFSNRELNEHMNSIRDIISDPSKDWNKRVDAVSYNRWNHLNIYLSQR